MKSHKLLYQLKNKLTWLPILILAACQNNIIYHSYAPVPLDGWDKSDTLGYTLPNPIRTEGSARTFRIVHIMTDNPLTGISDIGIRLRKPENQ